MGSTRIALAACAALAAAGIGAGVAASDEVGEDRGALAGFQQIEKPQWDPVRFGELAADFAERERRLGLAEFVQPTVEWDPSRFAALAAAHGVRAGR